MQIFIPLDAGYGLTTGILLIGFASPDGPMIRITPGCKDVEDEEPHEIDSRHLPAFDVEVARKVREAISRIESAIADFLGDEADDV
ncbi:MAG: hypothetical protein JWL61_2205 [Gemmatimonadetes bacterium]|nr:hypothetical protein [Gemmatimonadota bacterium]